MKKLAVATLILSFNTSLALAGFDCTVIKNEKDKIACLKDMRLLEDKYTTNLKTDTCAKFKTMAEYKLCEAVEIKKDPCFPHRKYGTHEGSSYEKCFIGKESAKAEKNVSDLKRESKVVEHHESAPVKIRTQTSGR